MTPPPGGDPKVVVIGVGNLYRSDDGVGARVTGLLRKVVHDGVEVVECDGEAAGLLLAWEGADLAIVVDAVHCHTACPGHIFRFEMDGSTQARPPSALSSHATGPGEAVALARTLGRLPRRLIMYGVEGDIFLPGEDLTPAVEASLSVVVARIVTEIRAATRTRLVATDP